MPACSWLSPCTILPQEKDHTGVRSKPPEKRGGKQPERVSAVVIAFANPQLRPQDRKRGAKKRCQSRKRRAKRRCRSKWDEIKLNSTAEAHGLRSLCDFVALALHVMHCIQRGYTRKTRLVALAPQRQADITRRHRPSKPTANPRRNCAVNRTSGHSPCE